MGLDGCGVNMTLVVLAIGIVLLVSAFRGTYGTLFTALGTDVPGFVIWAAAIVALGAIGFIPGLKPISRGLLALVIVVLIFQNYANILAGFQQVASPPAPKASGTGATGSTAPEYGPETSPSAFGSDGESSGNATGMTVITVNGGANG